MLSPSDTASLRSLLLKVWAAKGARSWVRLVDTQSMSPTLSGNVFLLVEWTASPNLQPGTLVLFPSPHAGLLVVHRVCDLKITESGVQVLQMADRLIADDEIGSGWLPAESIFGHVVAIRWGKPGAKVTCLESRLYHFFGILIATLSAKWREQMKQSYANELGTRKTLTRLTVSALHRLLCYSYAFILRVSAGVPQENSI